MSSKVSLEEEIPVNEVYVPVRGRRVTLTVRNLAPTNPKHVSVTMEMAETETLERNDRTCPERSCWKR